MRSALVSAALIFGGLLRRLGAVLFGIRTIREEAQRGHMYPRRYAIGGRPDLLISNDGPAIAILARDGSRFSRPREGGAPDLGASRSGRRMASLERAGPVSVKGTKGTLREENRLTVGTLALHVDEARRLGESLGVGHAAASANNANSASRAFVYPIRNTHRHFA
jgi:hypothetical protein